MWDDIQTLTKTITKYKSKNVTKDNVDELVLGDDEISTKILELMTEEKAIEDTLDQLRQDFWKKKFDLKDYLMITRQLSDELFGYVN